MKRKLNYERYKLTHRTRRNWIDPNDSFPIRKSSHLDSSRHTTLIGRTEGLDKGGGLKTNFPNSKETCNKILLQTPVRQGSVWIWCTAHYTFRTKSMNAEAIMKLKIRLVQSVIIYTHCGLHLCIGEGTSGIENDPPEGNWSQLPLKCAKNVSNIIII